MRSSSAPPVLVLLRVAVAAMTDATVAGRVLTPGERAERNIEWCEQVPVSARGQARRRAAGDGRVHAGRFPRDLRQPARHTARDHLTRPQERQERRVRRDRAAASVRSGVSAERLDLFLRAIARPSRDHLRPRQQNGEAVARCCAAWSRSARAPRSCAAPATGTMYKALSAETSTAFGLSPVLTIHDELGQVKGPRFPLYEAMETSTAAQDEPLTVVISTQAPTDADLLSMLIDDAATRCRSAHRAPVRHRADGRRPVR